MSNPDCINCKEKRGLKDRCVCNNERRCGNCKYCNWCIDNKRNGKCVPNYKYNIENCPYSFSNNWKKTDFLKRGYFMDNDDDISSYKYIYFGIIIFLLLIIIFYLIFSNPIRSCP